MHYCLLLIILSTAYFCFSFHGHLLLLLLHVKLIMTSHFSQRWTNYDFVLIITHQRRRSKEEFLLFIIFLCGFTWVNCLGTRMTVGSNEFCCWSSLSSFVCLFTILLHNLYCNNMVSKCILYSYALRETNNFLLFDFVKT